MPSGETNSYLFWPGADLWEDWTLVSLSVSNAAGETLWLGPTFLWVYPLAIHIPGSPTNSSGPAERYPATINVRGQSNNFSRVEVTLHNLRHAYPADLDILLVGPTGTKIMLMSSAGGSTTVSNATLRFHPNWYAQQLGYGYAPQQGAIPSNQTSNYKCSNHGGLAELPGAPPGPYSTDLNDLSGSNPNETWELYIYDHKANHTGVLQDSWNLEFIYPPQ
jgi:hypothetical protein